MVNLEGKNCVVIGGGEVAERKVASLMEYGGCVKLISPHITANLRRWAEDKKIIWKMKNYQWGDLESAHLIFAATDNPEVNLLCYQEASQRSIPINVADMPHLCDYIVPAVIQRGELSIMISTNGKSPMLSRKIREELEVCYDEIYGDYITLLGELRQKVLKEVADIQQRKAIFKKVIYSDLQKQEAYKEIADLREAIEKVYETMKKEYLDR